MYGNIDREVPRANTSVSYAYYAVVAKKKENKKKEGGWKMKKEDTKEEEKKEEEDTKFEIAGEKPEKEKARKRQSRMRRSCSKPLLSRKEDGRGGEEVASRKKTGVVRGRGDSSDRVWWWRGGNGRRCQCRSVSYRSYSESEPVFVNSKLLFIFNELRDANGNARVSRDLDSVKRRKDLSEEVVTPKIESWKCSWRYQTSREFLISLWRGRVCQLTKGKKEEVLMENVFALTTVEKSRWVEKAERAKSNHLLAIEVNPFEERESKGERGE
ncbi:hypothetical protein V1478_008293 [Vespula squamosa]|uniref:Uncharacterized protein n=1 Tax=Vespula squamosa TaxID=30214 RepID=A0ABD2B092_VESSQ